MPARAGNRPLSPAPAKATGDSAGITDAQGTGRMVMAGLGRVAAHPGNPRGAELGDLSDLTASITAQGVLEPLIVITAAAFGTAHPRLRIADQDVEFVIVAGHRRHAAAHAAGLAELPVIVRDDLAADGRDVETMLAENLHREGLSPIQEARAFTHLRALGRSQRQIAVAIGCGQSHVSKRLALLELPTTAQNAVNAGQISVGAAEYLLKLRDHPDALAEITEDLLADLEQQGDDGRVEVDDVAWGVDDALRRIQTQQRAEQTRRQLEDAGVTVLDRAEVGRRYGREAWDRRLYDKRQIQKARQHGELVAAVDVDGSPAYYTTGALDKPPDNRSRVDPDSRQERNHRRTAMHARAEACATLVKTPPAKDTLIAVLATAVIIRQDYAACLTLAHGWLPGHGNAPATGHQVTDIPDASPYAYAERVAAGDDPKQRAQLAYAMAIAQLEVRARGTWRRWDHTDAAYLRLLTDKTGYQPTPWEHARLGAATTGDHNDDTTDGNPTSQNQEA